MRQDIIDALDAAALDIKVGAVCVYHARVKDALGALPRQRHPRGGSVHRLPRPGLAPSPSASKRYISRLEAGADEIDIVISREHALRGDWRRLYEEVREMRAACGDAHMKAILATGELGPLWTVARASKVCMMAGADFIKTSTGKEPVNATLEVGLTMVREIRAYREMTGAQVGFKPAGGIRSAKDALSWMILMKGGSLATTGWTNDSSALARRAC